MKKVYKYGTGAEIPEGAEYLCTKTETLTKINSSSEELKQNILVWHYFLVEVKE